VGLIMRPSENALSSVGRALTSSRNELVARWAAWIAHRTAQAPQIDRATTQRQLGLLIDIVIEMTAPLRREAAQLWFDACESYGRTAATRGLAAGEVVEEIQHLREILIRELSEIIAALPARHSMATILRLNRQVDRGIAQAVVGYTDALIETLFSQRGVPVSAPEPVDFETVKRLEQLESDLARLREKHS